MDLIDIIFWTSGFLVGYGLASIMIVKGKV